MSDGDRTAFFHLVAVARCSVPPLVRLVPLLCVDSFLLRKKPLLRAALLIGYGWVMWGIEALCVHFQSFTFPHWDLIDSLVTYYLYLLLDALLLIWFRLTFSKSEVQVP
ncbi:hypothetical protein [Tumebacillus flagellatus]|uniref:Uncharacterized protein n=1 Tax=Tumebacillus flagellatus TaxID=1157490 RepID=A0A074LT79_9BACL|nr:hypothetical protein [Tumebacillus flagellatus]KEO83710.1 hypothetical protein EL26_08650 [Tumebacillus flagellatus]